MKNLTDYLLDKVQAAEIRARELEVAKNYEMLEKQNAQFELNVAKAKISELESELAALKMEGNMRKIGDVVASVSSANFFGKPAATTDIPWTPRLKKCLALARKQAIKEGHLYVGQEHLLAGIILEKEGDVSRLLARNGVTLDVVADAAGWNEPEPITEPVVTPQYRMLEEGEIVEPTDEVLKNDGVTWDLAFFNVGKPSPYCGRYRRPI